MSEQPAPDQANSQPSGLTPPVPPSPDPNASGEPNGYALPSREDILYKLGHIPGLIATGILSPAKANAMKAIYATILSHLDDSSPSGAAHLADEDVIKILKQQPELLKVLQPFLTKEHLDLIMREAPK